MRGGKGTVQTEPEVGLSVQACAWWGSKCESQSEQVCDWVLGMAWEERGSKALDFRLVPNQSRIFCFQVEFLLEEFLEEKKLWVGHTAPQEGKQSMAGVGGEQGEVLPGGSYIGRGMERCSSGEYPDRTIWLG